MLVERVGTAITSKRMVLTGTQTSENQLVLQGARTEETKTREAGTFCPCT